VIVHEFFKAPGKCIRILPAFFIPGCALILIIKVPSVFIKTIKHYNQLLYPGFILAIVLYEINAQTAMVFAQIAQV
jgi:hypothetical protein